MFLLIIKTGKDPNNSNFFFDKLTLPPELGHMFIPIKWHILETLAVPIFSTLTCFKQVQITSSD